MDKIWDRNPSKSKVIGRCGGDQKTNKSQTLKKKKEFYPRFYPLLFCPILVLEKEPVFPFFNVEC